jgi:glycine oxidase
MRSRTGWRPISGGGQGVGPGVSAPLRKARIVVAGSGAFGASIALALARAGAWVMLADPAAPGDNASGVAAGMLAPAFEAVLDPIMDGRFVLLREARDLWPGFIEMLGGADVGLRKAGALWLGPDGLDAREAELAAIGAAPRRWSAAEVSRRLPGVWTEAGGAFTDEDWRLSPVAALAAMRAASQAAGMTFAGQGVAAFDAGVVRLADGSSIRADHLVLATGAQTSDLAPELARLTPIKGHILQYPTLATRDGPTVRCAGGYVVGGADGLHVGATMELGLADLAVDAAAVASLAALGSRLFPELARLTPIARTGVRAATADGLPLVGPSSRPGVLLAVGARRNGWLLAPLVARMTAAYLAGGDPGPHASVFDARRFAAA